MRSSVFHLEAAVALPERNLPSVQQLVMTALEDGKAHPARAAVLHALDDVRPALSELGAALANLRGALPPEARREAERLFMNAFGNAVVAEARTCAERAASAT